MADFSETVGRYTAVVMYCWGYISATLVKSLKQDVLDRSSCVVTSMHVTYGRLYYISSGIDIDGFNITSALLIYQLHKCVVSLFALVDFDIFYQSWNVIVFQLLLR